MCRTRRQQTHRRGDHYLMFQQCILNAALASRRCQAPVSWEVFPLFGRRQSAADYAVPQETVRFWREAERLLAMKVALRSHLAVLAFFLCGIVAAIWVLEAFTAALHNSQDNDWGAARALLHGL